MIHYQLRCSQAHGFDGWFRDSGAFDVQARAGLLTCPVCSSSQIGRALMSPAVGSGRAAPAQIEATPAAPAKPEPVAGGAMPDGMRAMLQKMRAEVEARCHYVGDRFAAEARAIHSGESDARAIYGEATPEQADRLAEDGIEVARIPWVPRADG